MNHDFNNFLHVDSLCFTSNRRFAGSSCLSFFVENQITISKVLGEIKITC